MSIASLLLLKSVRNGFHSLSRSHLRFISYLANRSSYKSTIGTVDSQRIPCAAAGTCLPRGIQVHPFSTSTCAKESKVIGQLYGDGKLIYCGTKGKVVKGVQIGVYSIGALLVLSSPFLLENLSDQTFMQYILVMWVTLFGVVNPALYYKFSKRYTEELYHDKETGKYTAVVISPFVFGSRKIVFSAKECRMPNGPAAFTSFLVKGDPLLVSSDGMDYDEYSKMLRYALEFDYENPERQEQYQDAVKQPIHELEKSDHQKNEDGNTPIEK